jgi:hypothetical protein
MQSPGQVVFGSGTGDAARKPAVTKIREIRCRYSQASPQLNRTSLMSIDTISSSGMVDHPHQIGTPVAWWAA